MWVWPRTTMWWPRLPHRNCDKSTGSMELMACVRYVSYQKSWQDRWEIPSCCRGDSCSCIVQTISPRWCSVRSRNTSAGSRRCGSWSWYDSIAETLALFRQGKSVDRGPGLRPLDRALTSTNQWWRMLQQRFRALSQSVKMRNCSVPVSD